ncbi:hypothetical protein BZA77DRAFT_390788, partial [Pyronema omphalodes]
MSVENFDEKSVYPSTQASTPGFDTPPASEIMSTSPTANLQMTSSIYENMFKNYQNTFMNLG